MVRRKKMTRNYGIINIGYLKPYGAELEPEIIEPEGDILSFPLHLKASNLVSIPTYMGGSPSFILDNGAFINNPSFFEEILADPSLEVYSGEDNTSLIFTGGVREKLTTGVYDGLYAQSWVPDGAYQSVLNILQTEAQEWYHLIAHTKRLAGSAGNTGMSAYQVYEASTRPVLTSSEYITRHLYLYSDTLANTFLMWAASGSVSPYDTIALDRISFKKVNKETLIKLVVGQSGFTVKIKVGTWDAESLLGVVSHSDGTLRNCLLAQYIITPPTPAYNSCILDAYVEGVRTRLVMDYTNSFSASGGQPPLSDHWLEIRPEGVNQVRLYQNNLPIGAAVTIPEALRLNNKFGWIDGGGNRVTDIFVGQPIPVNIGSMGSSNTYDATGYFYDLHNVNHPEYIVTKKNAAMNGNGIMSYGLSHFDDLAGSVQVIWDTTGDQSIESLWSVEAAIRKCYANNYKALVVVLPVWTNEDLNDSQVNDPMSKDVIPAYISLLNHYGVPHFNMWTAIKDHVAAGGHISDWFADIYHLTDAGDLVLSAGLAQYYVTGGSITLASRIYPESEALE
jgi:hypothetical protein